MVAAGITEADVQTLLDAIAVVATPGRISYLWTAIRLLETGTETSRMDL